MLQERLNIAKQVYNILKTNCDDFIIESYLFGSTAKRCVHQDSDVDILLIGKREKSIILLNSITKLFEVLEESTGIEINIVYYNIDKFKELLNEGSAFIANIEPSCIKLSEL